MTGWLGRRALRTIHQFRTRLARYHLQQRRTAKAALIADPMVEQAVLRHAVAGDQTHVLLEHGVIQGLPEAASDKIRPE